MVYGNVLPFILALILNHSTVQYYCSNVRSLCGNKSVNQRTEQPYIGVFLHQFLGKQKITDTLPNFPFLQLTLIQPRHPAEEEGLKSSRESPEQVCRKRRKRTRQRQSERSQTTKLCGGDDLRQSAKKQHQTTPAQSQSADRCAQLSIIDNPLLILSACVSIYQALERSQELQPSNGRQSE